METEYECDIKEIAKGIVNTAVENDTNRECLKAWRKFLSPEDLNYTNDLMI